MGPVEGGHKKKNLGEEMLQSKKTIRKLQRAGLGAKRIDQVGQQVLGAAAKTSPLDERGHGRNGYARPVMGGDGGLHVCTW
ncbi:hypothetical protein BCR44DRAFT_1262655 [Catenaria anguillulae PL171]|uniref:Uncharacterized protein n=1 Tax=Catenaria anguillulae PL171 TaxID=765915 RepID=A0A1Y2HAT5_9FUNG|nr:hypothetical protein BCR44DRAFT_1262655 [Catenaria anguillulae PL171]